MRTLHNLSICGIRNAALKQGASLAEILVIYFQLLESWVSCTFLTAGFVRKKKEHKAFLLQIHLQSNHTGSHEQKVIGVTFAMRLKEVREIEGEIERETEWKEKERVSVSEGKENEGKKERGATRITTFAIQKTEHHMCGNVWRSFPSFYSHRNLLVANVVRYPAFSLAAEGHMILPTNSKKIKLFCSLFEVHCFFQLSSANQFCFERWACRVVIVLSWI